MKSYISDFPEAKVRNRVHASWVPGDISPQKQSDLELLLGSGTGVPVEKRAPRTATATASKESSKNPYSDNCRNSPGLNKSESREKSNPFCLAPPVNMTSKGSLNKGS